MLLEVGREDLLAVLLLVALVLLLLIALVLLLILIFILIVLAFLHESTSFRPSGHVPIVDGGRENYTKKFEKFLLTNQQLAGILKKQNKEGSASASPPANGQRGQQRCNQTAGIGGLLLRGCHQVSAFCDFWMEVR